MLLFPTCNESNSLVKYSLKNDSSIQYWGSRNCICLELIYLRVILFLSPVVVSSLQPAQGGPLARQLASLVVTPQRASHRPYQIVESEKILSRMIFQSQLWLLLLLSLRDYGHRVTTLCHQLFLSENSWVSRD